MGRLTAWIASRRQSPRSPRAHSTSGTSDRPLRFEQYEGRIALSTNAVFEVVPVDNSSMNAREGGWIQYDFADTLVVAPTESATRSFLSANNAFYDNLDFTVVKNSWLQGPVLLDAGLSDFDFSGSSSEIMLTETRIVPISPPTAGQGGNEGGQISMTPFMGPATLGLPSAGDSLYAAKTRPALRPASLDAATDNSDSTPTDSLRARAVVYEVAHAEQRLNGERDHRANVEVSLANLEHESEWNETQALTRASRHERAAVADRDDESYLPTAYTSASNDPTRRRTDADALMVVETTVASAEVDEVRKTSVESPNDVATAADAAAHDAAFAEWLREPALDSRVVAAATADSQQRRVLGAALIVLGAVPVTKALRRHAHHESVEDRPRERQPRNGQ